MIIAIVLQSMTGLMSAFVPWYELFLLFKFISAVATGGTMLVSFVLCKCVFTMKKEGLHNIKFNNCSNGNSWNGMAINNFSFISHTVSPWLFDESSDIIFNTKMVHFPNSNIDTTDNVSLLLLVGSFFMLTWYERTIYPSPLLFSLTSIKYGSWVLRFVRSVTEL